MHARLAILIFDNHQQLVSSSTKRAPRDSSTLFSVQQSPHAFDRRKLLTQSSNPCYIERHSVEPATSLRHAAISFVAPFSRPSMFPLSALCYNASQHLLNVALYFQQPVNTGGETGDDPTASTLYYYYYYHYSPIDS
jgi:hypothetical protein